MNIFKLRRKVIDIKFLKKCRTLPTHPIKDLRITLLMLVTSRVGRTLIFEYLNY